MLLYEGGLHEVIVFLSLFKIIMRSIQYCVKALALLVIGMGLASTRFLQFHFGLQPLTTM